MNQRIGFGYDVHKFKRKLSFFLGGIQIPFSKGCIAHSDGDVLIHSICDALLGAANLRDIGYHFPDNNNEYKNIDSKVLLNKTIELISKEGYKIGNIDCTICLEKPKINIHIPQMVNVLTNVMGIKKDLLSIKATTTEKLGFVGRGKGISAYSVVLIESKIN